MKLKAWFWLQVKEWVPSILFAAILVFGIIRPFIVQAFKIPSGSMRPTLMEGDKLFVNKFIYRFHAPERGDIIVFKYPGNAYEPNEPKSEKKKDFIKRLTAFGGEVVEIRDGNILIDGKKLDDPTLFGRFFYFNHDPFGAPYQKVKVPTGSYFVLGDNSASSRDSRFWGFVPKKNVLGKAFFRWWPLNKIGKLE